MFSTQLTNLKSHSVDTNDISIPIAIARGDIGIGIGIGMGIGATSVF